VAVSGLALLGGVQLIAVGLLGEYMGRVFDEVRGRPLYLVQETVGMAGGTRAVPPPTVV
jgi:dolichol-phosphate mannosyltransferase